MINTKKTKPLLLYPPISVKLALKKAAKKLEANSSSLGSDIITGWLVKNKYLKTKKVDVLDD